MTVRQRILLSLFLVLAGALGGCGASPSPRETDGIGPNAHPVYLTPDRDVLFAATRQGRSHLLVADRTTGAVQTWAQNRLPLSWPAISPDGTRIAAVAGSRIVLFSPRGRFLRTLAAAGTGGYRAPCFNAAGDAILVQRAQEHAFMQAFWRVPCLGGAPHRYAPLVAWNPSPHHPLAGAPRGLVFTQKTRLEGQAREGRFPYRLCELQPGATHVTYIDFPLPLAPIAPQINLLPSPDGSAFAYVTPVEHELKLVARDGRVLRALAGPRTYPSAFSPDGEFLVALQRQETGAGYAILEFAIRTGEVHHVVDGF